VIWCLLSPRVMMEDDIDLLWQTIRFVPCSANIRKSSYHDVNTLHDFWTLCGE
jgi:hypothetical protein